jgi:hypothetical protein
MAFVVRGGLVVPEGRTQGAVIAVAIGATEDAASGRSSTLRRHNRYFAEPS